MRFESQLLKGVAPVVVLEILSRGWMYGYELSQDNKGKVKLWADEGDVVFWPVHK